MAADKISGLCQRTANCSINQYGRSTKGANYHHKIGFIKEGIGFGTPETLKKISIEDWLDHLDHTVSLVGTDHVGIGSDFDGGCGFPGLDDITKFPDLTRGILSRGYSESDIEKILGLNNLNVFKKVLK